MWDFSLFDSMGIIGKKVYGDFSEENIRKVMKEENYQEAEIILNRVKKIMSKPMIYYGIVARYNDGSHEILQQELVDYYRGERRGRRRGRRGVKDNSFWRLFPLFVLKIHLGINSGPDNNQ